MALVRACQVDLSEMTESELKKLQKKIDKKIKNIKAYNFHIDGISCKNERQNYILYIKTDQQRYNKDYLSVVNKEIYRSDNINDVLAYIKTLKGTLSKAEQLLESAILAGGE